MSERACAVCGTDLAENVLQPTSGRYLCRAHSHVPAMMFATERERVSAQRKFIQTRYQLTAGEAEHLHRTATLATFDAANMMVEAKRHVPEALHGKYVLLAMTMMRDNIDITLAARRPN